MERLKLRFIGRDHSMGLRKDGIYILNGKISGGYIYLDINGITVPYTISGFLANWETVASRKKYKKDRKGIAKNK